MNKQEVIERMCQSGVLPVFRTSDVRNLLPASKAFYDAGIGCVEYTMTMPGALQLLKEGVATSVGPGFFAEVLGPPPGNGWKPCRRHARQNEIP